MSGTPRRHLAVENAAHTTHLLDHGESALSREPIPRSDPQVVPHGVVGNGDGVGESDDAHDLINLVPLDIATQ